MKPEQDAYGQEVYDHYVEMGASSEIVERDDGYIALSAGPPAYFAPFAEWPAWFESESATKRSKVPGSTT